MLSKLFIMLINLNIMPLPVQSIEQAKERYGPLTSNYEMVDKDKHLILFDFKIFGIDKVALINKDIKMPLILVAAELKEKGLLSEITEFKGCFSSRPIRGTNRPSIHAYGLGCDFNHIQFSSEFVDTWKRYGWCWGGDFTTWPDYMHFSYSWECKFNTKEVNIK